MNRKQIALWLVIVVSAVVVVTVRHHNRLAFIRLQTAEAERVELQSEWGRLMLERATWSMHNNVADTARKSLAMAPPAPEKIITLDIEEK